MPIQRHIRRVITCTRCGTRNDDQAKYCERCNNKLQSGRFQGHAHDNSYRPLSEMKNEVPESTRLSIRTMTEAWILIIVVMVAAGFCYFNRTWWPMVPTMLVAFIIAKLRNI